MIYAKFLLFCVAVLPSVSFGEEAIPKCINSKTLDDCAVCCGQLVGKNQKPSALVIGCTQFVSTAKVESEKKEILRNLETQTGIRADSLKAICTPDKRLPQGEASFRQVASSIKKSNASKLKANDPAYCLDLCSKLSKKNIGN
ncbi:MAG: hypothetical protein ACXVCP_08360 [Bdellovibrio sp.]